MKHRTQEELRYTEGVLRQFWKKNKAKCMTLLGRTLEQCKHDACVFGLVKKRPRWAPWEDAYVRENWLQVPVERMARTLHRSKVAILWHASHALKLPVALPQGYVYVTVAAKQCGYDEPTFLRILKWGMHQRIDGLPLIEKPRKLLTSVRGATARKIVDEGQAKILVEWFLQHEHISHAADRFGVSVNTLRQVLAAAGTPVTKSNGWSMYVYVHKDAVQRAYELFLKHTIATEAVRTGRSKTTLVLVYRRYGQSSPSTRLQRVVPILPELTDSYLVQHDAATADRHFRAAKTRKVNQAMCEAGLPPDEVLLRLGGACTVAEDLSGVPAIP